MPFATPGNRHGRAFPQVPSDSRPLRHATRRRRAWSTIDEFVADERGGKFSGAQSVENSESAERISLRESLARFPCRAVPPARKWRHNSLKRLNPRPEMVWSWKPRSHNIWYTGAWLTVRSGELISEPRLPPGGYGSR